MKTKREHLRKYAIGDKVTAPGFSEELLQIDSSFWNGFTFMYHFRGTDMGIGEKYLVRQSSVIQKMANATKTYYRAGGHHKTKMNKEKKEEYAAALLAAGEKVPTDEELLKIGVFNGEGAY